MKDYYEILEVNKKASNDTIKKVFRMLIKKNHPDLFEGKEKIKAEEKVKELNEAYEVLINKESREKYNLELAENDKSNEEALAILMEENQYLKNVIQEKNILIKEYFDEVEEEQENIQKIYSNISKQDINNETMVEGYNLYRRKEQINKIIYVLLMILVGVITLSIVTDINVFKIFIEVFKNMF